MYICICNAVTDSDISNAVDGGAHTLKQLKRTTGCTDSCGCCKEMAVEVLKQALAEKWETQGLLPGLQLA